MKNSIFIFALVALFATACSSDDKSREETLKEQNKTLINAAIDKNKQIENYRDVLNRLDHRLQQIRLRNKPLAVSTNDAEFSKSSIDQKLILIEDFLEQSRYELSVMESKLRKNEADFKAYDRQLATMRNHLEDQFEEVDQLQSKLTDSQIALEAQRAQAEELVRTVEQKEDELDKAWFAFGTFEELKEKAVVEKRGGILGIGAVKSLTPEFNKKYFTEIDIEEVNRIPIMSKKVEIITNHPNDSFRVVGEEQIEYIEILDAEKFWSVSKYLTVVVK
ncbi:Cbp1 family collagen-binding glycoprotein adhesin [Halocola ammonii]